MARNDARRAELADAAIAVVADEGMRGLTHRAVDARAHAPMGTASNYFRSRDALTDAIVTRIGERLTPAPDVHEELAARVPGPELFADYLRDIVRRLLGDRQVALALFTLRLEAARNPTVADRLGRWMRAGFEADVAFNRDARLPGEAFDIALFHYAIDGLILDRLTVQIDPETSTDAVVDAFVDGLLRGRMSS
ncbi:TetR family transcriptional regulator [Microbacterium sp. B35-04]|uniref:TetR/AcrR family transcriptional regulator n=1 Tax=unclassified Microbacterium TaxID=2609290 RepID=UPI0013D1D0A1|nr:MULTISPECIES: TetR/AcrR family transcriptional regulator [unclassified Microbacterium]KAF2411559.1 TetR family transcriptional regulator [Microbacterium sp. B35-04]KAF2416853.1 TetR family transcriptional regulator [Microbacterium sp. B35-30]